MVHSAMSVAKGVMWKGEPVSSIQLPQSPNRRCRSSCDAVSDLEARASRAEPGVAVPTEDGKAGAAVPIQLPDDDPTDANQLGAVPEKTAASSATSGRPGAELEGVVKP